MSNETVNKYRLTFLNRLKICFEVLTVKSSNEKDLSVFKRGYDAGMYDIRLMKQGDKW